MNRSPHSSTPTHLKMNEMLSEIQEMPARAALFLQQSKPFTLPTGVPYIGMGSSYFAPLAFRYMGVNIQPEMASEFYHYLSPEKKRDNGVLLSQSGRSTEVLWCTECFQKFTVLTNYPENALGSHAAAENVIELLAGEEKYSSSKTYINTLLALCKGFGIDATAAVRKLEENTVRYNEAGQAMAEKIYAQLQSGRVSGMYITGSGPNMATAYQAALILSESTKLSFLGLPMAQYDHGPKETAPNSIVINILAKGPAYDRTVKLRQTVAAAGATVFTVEEPAVPENLSVINNMVPFNYLAYYLAQKLGVGETFVVGGKVTEVM